MKWKIAGMIFAAVWLISYFYVLFTEYHPIFIAIWLGWILISMKGKWNAR